MEFLHLAFLILNLRTNRIFFLHKVDSSLENDNTALRGRNLALCFFLIDSISQAMFIFFKGLKQEWRLRFYNPNDILLNKESSVIIFQRVEKLQAKTESGAHLL